LIEQQTFRLDCIRFTLQGFIDIFFKNYTLLMAIRVFEMPDHAKGLLSAAPYIGMALTPFAVYFFTRICPLPSNYAVSALLFVTGGAIGIAFWTDRWFNFLIAIVVAKIFYKQTLPFVIDIYNRNYPKERRGRIIGKLFTILALSSITLAKVCGQLLDNSLMNYRHILLMAGLAALAGGYIFRKMPNGHIITKDSHFSLRSNLLILCNDRLFSLILFLWSLMSIAFQMTYPLRMEYLANRRYGLNLSNDFITLIAVIIPSITRVVSALFWGKIFDTQNFAIMKIMINLCFLVSIPTFFFTDNFIFWILSAIALGLSYSGNLTAWQLWVTKIAPSPEKLGAYVSLDAAIMGFRDALATSLGYFLLSHTISLQTICILALLLTGISAVGFCFLVNHPRMR
jgi:predicted MFS family arabinose efflux permease